MSDFIKDTLLIDDQLPVPTGIAPSVLKAVILPYYMDPDSLDLTVVVKRSLLPGGFARTGRKMGISALTVELPEDTPITLDQAYASLNLTAKMQNAIPFGSVMPSPESSSEAFELVLVHTEPFEFLDKKRGIIHQEKGKYEIGAVKFAELIEGISGHIISDMKTRLILNELYILAIEESMKQQQGTPGNQTVGRSDMVGGGSNLPPGFGDQTDTVKTSTIPDDIIAKNSQTDFGAMYARASTNGDFKTIERPE